MKRWKKQVCGTISKSMEIYNMKEKAEELAGNLEWMAMVDGELELAWSPYMGASSKAQPATCGRGMMAMQGGGP